MERREGKGDKGGAEIEIKKYVFPIERDRGRV